MQAIMVSVPVRRPSNIPPMKKMEECFEQEREDGLVISSGNKFRSLLPDGVERTMVSDIDIGTICRVDDAGEWNEDGTFRPIYCIVHFRTQLTPPLEVEMTRVDFMHMVSSTTQALFSDMRKAQMGGGLAIANGPIPQQGRVTRR